MLELLKDEEFAGDPRLRITNFELSLPRPTQTIRTIGALAAENSNINFWYVFGLDSYEDMPNWDDGVELQTTLPMVIIGRNGGVMPEREGIVQLKVGTDSDISSTLVRERAKLGMSLDDLVCPAIQKYILENMLYQG